MATANYMTMENFPLFVKEFNTQIKRCPACGLYQDCENDVCEECGEELEEELFFDSIECQELVDDIESRLENDVNGGLTFHKISKEYGFDELYLRARFSNGEALYGRVENTSRAKLMQAVSPRV